MAKFVLFRTDWLKDIDECGHAVDVNDVREIFANEDRGATIVVSRYENRDTVLNDVFVCEHITDVVAKINAARNEDRS